jgi:hypothetical protein
MKNTAPLKSLLPVLLISLGLPFAASADSQGVQRGGWKPPRVKTLVDRVYETNKQWADINYARSQMWKDLTPCVSGPEFGAMGIHLFLKSRLDGKVNPDEPELLIYEPLSNGTFRLVGVEFLVPAALWVPTDEQPTPSVDGKLMNYIPGPNRYGAGALYELHVWAFEKNPLGAFADWNTRVSCEKQPSD